MTAVRESLGHPAQKITGLPPDFAPTPRHGSRAVAGLLLAAHRHAEFEVLDSGLIRVPSRSRPNTFWTVDLGASSRDVCPCPVYRYGDPKTGIRHLCHHVTAAELVVLFRDATEGTGVSFRVERRHDSRFGITTHDVIERSYDYPAGRCWSTALSLEGALMDVVEAMQDRVGEAGA